MDSINKIGSSSQRGILKLPRFGISPLSISVVVITLGVMTPLLFLMWFAASSDVDHWEHLSKYVLPTAALNTLILLLGVGAIVMVIGAGCAWLVTAFDFPGKRLLSWSLLLPLAMPTYIIAFAWLDLLHPIGPIQELIRNVLGYSSPREFRLPDLRSMTGAVVLLGLVLYPYVYLTMRAMFMSQPAHLLEAARTLGLSATGTFFRVALPMARPALVVGTSLALLETLNDIGASEFLGVNTLTVTVYTTWVTRSDLAAAAQIACSMLTVIILLLGLEYYGRKNQRYSTGRQMRGIVPTRLTGGSAWLATFLAALPVLLGFVAPALFLGWESLKRITKSMEISASLLQSLQNSLLLATGVTIVVTFVSLIVAWYARPAAISGGSPNTRRTFMKIASLGYAVPGTVLAIGLLTPGMALDNVLADLFNYQGLPLLSSGILLVICCSIRFMAISIGAIDSGLTRISPSMEQASRLLGEREFMTFFRVHLPLLRPALMTSALLVFADAMKELPSTLLLRPVNFETLATSLYAEAARGTYEEGAIAALLIVLVGILPVIFLDRSQYCRPSQNNKDKEMVKC